MKKGFTLIELLAVIVILAIIAVIAVPIVIDIIEDTKINSIKTSASMYLKSAELYISNAELNKVKIESRTYGITEEGDICTGIIEENECNGEIINIEIKGSKPNRGQIIINEKGNVKIEYLEIDGYVYYKDNDEYVVEKGKIDSVNSDNGIITIDSSKTGVLSNYRIYGNSYQETVSGKNLFNISNIIGGLRDDYFTNASGLIIDNDGIITSNVGVYNYNILLNGSKIRLEKGTYTISADFMSDKESGNKGIVIGVKDLINKKYKVIYPNLSEYKKWERKSYKFDIEEDTDVAILVQAGGEQGDNTNLNLKIKNIQLEKGATATTYEPYYEMPSLEHPSEINSVGNLITDENHEHHGKYEIPIRVTGKNLFDISNKTKSETCEWSPETVRNFEFDKFYIGLTANNYCGSSVSYRLEEESIFISSLSTGYGIGVPIEVKSNTNYTISAEKRSFILIGEYTKNGQFIKMTDSHKFTSTASTKIITIVLAPEGGKGYLEYKNIQLEEGTNSTGYEAHVEPKSYYIYLDEPLRCVGSVCDYIDYESGKVVRYIVEIDNDPTKTIEENFEVLSKPIIENIELPKININEKTTNIFIETDIKPSKVSIDYYN